MTTDISHSTTEAALNAGDSPGSDMLVRQIRRDDFIPDISFP